MVRGYIFIITPLLKWWIRWLVDNFYKFSSVDWKLGLNFMGIKSNLTSLAAPQIQIIRLQAFPSPGYSVAVARIIKMPQTLFQLQRWLFVNNSFCHGCNMRDYFFGTTGLPPAWTRWVRSTFSSHCPHSSNQRRWLTSATWILFPLKFWECWESNPGLLGEKQVCYLCAMQPF